jgi:hypothetical protein
VDDSLFAVDARAHGPRDRAGACRRF